MQVAASQLHWCGAGEPVGTTRTRCLPAFNSTCVSEGPSFSCSSRLGSPSQRTSTYMALARLGHVITPICKGVWEGEFRDWVIALPMDIRQGIRSASRRWNLCPCSSLPWCGGHFDGEKGLKPLSSANQSCNHPSLCRESLAASP